MTSGIGREHMTHNVWASSVTAVCPPRLICIAQVANPPRELLGMQAFVPALLEHINELLIRAVPGVLK